METQLVQQPMIIIALSPREAKAALDDPAPLQSAIRREWLAAQGEAPLAIAAPAKNGGGKHRVKKRKPRGDGREFVCPQCPQALSSPGMLARHIRQKHADAAPAAPELVVTESEAQ